MESFRNVIMLVHLMVIGSGLLTKRSVCTTHYSNRAAVIGKTKKTMVLLKPKRYSNCVVAVWNLIRNGLLTRGVSAPPTIVMPSDGLVRGISTWETSPSSTGRRVMPGKKKEENETQSRKKKNWNFFVHVHLEITQTMVVVIQLSFTCSKLNQYLKLPVFAQKLW